MHLTNIEFKARVDLLETYEQKLLGLQPVFKGTDHQIDTYFNVLEGRLKLREGNIENALIQYHRENTVTSKKSAIILYKHRPDQALKDILTLQFGIKAVVDKTRKIYFIDHVKFHFDTVVDLGTFMEVEVIDENQSFTLEELQQQCDHYFHFFQLDNSQLIDRSYSDLVMEKQEKKIHKKKQV